MQAHVAGLGASSVSFGPLLTLYCRRKSCIHVAESGDPSGIFTLGDFTVVVAGADDRRASTMNYPPAGGGPGTEAALDPEP